MLKNNISVRIIRVVGVILILIFMLAVGSGLYLQWFALTAEGNERGKDVKGSYEYMWQTYPHIRQWTDSLLLHGALRDTFITAEDGTRLHALYALADSCTDRTAVIVHGYTDNAVRMLHIGYLYHHDLKYNILLPDLRFSGLSGGNHLQMGWMDRPDVLRWMEVADELFAEYGGFEHTQMVVHGISMGAATVMCVSGEPQQPYVRCFVEDCGFTSVWDEFAGELKNQFGLPEFPLLHVASLLTDLRYGWNFCEAAASSQVERCSLPMLFIHGDADTFVPAWMGDSVFHHKRGAKELWKPKGVEHAESYLKFPRLYTEKVRAFTDRYMQ